MNMRSLDPRRLDVAAAAESAAELSGQWPVLDLTRLAEMWHPDVRSDCGEQFAHWNARGERRTVASGPPQVWLHLKARADCVLVCQRCLQPVAVAVDAQRSFMFVAGEAAAAELDAQCEDDVLALTRELDLRELVEDELLLSLPLVPRHEQCPQPLLPPEDAASDDPQPGSPHPFAALAALKGRADKG
jgi:uncharacterized protein